jgi:peptide/nickel transport system substrate-binding protein
MKREHPGIDILKRDLAGKRISRRRFLRDAALLGLSSSAAYAFLGKLDGLQKDGWPAARQAKAALPRGGHLKLGMAVQDISHPHRYEWWEHNIARNVCEYLTKTGHDNITRPYLLREWLASDDLKTWTLYLRDDVRWRKGRRFTSDDVIWNLRKLLLEEPTGSVAGLMKSYILEDDQSTPGKYRLWDANAIERIDDFTLRLNLKVPQLAVPEHLFHYPFLILDPEEGSSFGVGSNGTGAFELVDFELGKRALLKAQPDYWGRKPNLDFLEFVDLGDDPANAIDALSRRRIHGLHFADDIQIDALKLLPHLVMHSVPTSDTAVVRGKVTEKPFDDPRIRKALRLAIDSRLTQRMVLRDAGLPGEHHHVAPIHPDYAELPEMVRDLPAAKALLAEAGYPDGIDLGEIDCKSSPSWEYTAVQAMVDQWRDAGIRCRINLMPSNEYWKIWNKTRFGFTEWAHRPLGVMVLGLAYRSGVPWNESGFANPRFDALLSEAEGILDADRRREILAGIERLMQEEGPVVQPIWRSVATFMDRKVMGFQMHPTRYIFGNELALDG